MASSAIYTIPIIDTHLHFWDVDLFKYPWLDEHPDINKTFSIEDYQVATQKFDIEKMVFVQCECLPQQALKEVEFVTVHAARDKRIQGIVAYAPIEQGRAVTKLLDRYKSYGLVKGIRRIYDDNPDICYSPSFLEALHLLPSFNYTLDISSKPHSMAATIHMIRECPNTFFILDHLGKPDVKNNGYVEFQKSIDVLAAFPNVVAKISGLITESNWSAWRVEELKPYIEYAIDKFGFDRIMFGGDWPVLLLAGSYEHWLLALSEILQKYSDEEWRKFFYKNAEVIYRL